MAVTDLVLLDIKHMFDEEHKKLTGHSNARVFAFAEYLKKIGKPVWIRHVVVKAWRNKSAFLFILLSFSL